MKYAATFSDSSCLLRMGAFCMIEFNLAKAIDLLRMILS